MEPKWSLVFRLESFTHMTLYCSTRNSSQDKKKINHFLRVKKIDY